MNQDQLKVMAAREALKYVKEDMIIGVGSGSTVDKFISLLPELPFKVKAVFAASTNSEKQLRALGIPVLNDSNDVCPLEYYFDGADEVTPNGEMIKGGGAALTREKILAAQSAKFVCMVDESKLVAKLGMTFPLPVEIIPLAHSLVYAKLQSLGGSPKFREGCVTDNHAHILDVHNFIIDDPLAMEKELNNTPGIITNGIFAIHKAAIVICGKKDGTVEVKELNKK